MIAKYLAFHTELQKRGMATIQSGQTQILLFFPIIRSVPSQITFLIRKTMLLIVCMRIYGDRVVSSNLRGEDVNFILGRFNYYTCVLIKHSYHKPKTLQLFCNKSFCFERRAVLVEKSMKKTQHFVYVHLYTLKNLLLFIFIFITRILRIQDGI